MNQAINFFWTILCFIPVIIFWILTNPAPYCYIFLLISILFQLVPLKVLQLSNNPAFYERLGVKFIRKFVQNGQYINSYIRHSNPGYKVVKHRKSASKYIKTAVMYERYHLICFVCFLLTAAYALALNSIWFFLLISLANVIYNISPILLQQYNKARINRMLKM
jgi:hypothetical protein